MDLNDQQELFVRMNTDAAFREELIASGFTEGHCFSSLKQEIEQNARSLVSKRLMVVAQILKSSCHALGRDRFEDEFRTYARKSEEPCGIHRHRLDALAFARVLDLKARSGVFPPAIIDLLAHETTPAKMWTERRRWLVRLHRRAPAELVRMAQAGADLAEAPLHPSLVLWSSPRERSHGYRWRQFTL